MNLQAIIDNYSDLEMARLYEMNMEAIRGYHVGRSSNDVRKSFPFFYELEYKYNMIQSHKFNGIPKRQENMLSIIEEKAEEVISLLAFTFDKVFKDWLEYHAVNDPKLWAKARVRELLDDRDMDFDEIYSTILSEYKRYAISFDKAVMKVANKFKSLRKFVREVNKDNEQYKGTEDERSDYTPQEYLEDNGTEETFTFIFNYRSDWGYQFLEELNQYVVFPVWYRKWKVQGIDKTRATIENIYKYLHEINNYSLKEQFGIINMATNACHQTGSMMEYYDNEYGIGDEDLEILSTRGIRKWKKELREIGVDI